MSLAEAVWRLSPGIPHVEARGLFEQMRSSATSVPANIAEGYGRESTGSYIQFLKIARGSLKELETHILLAQRVRIFDSSQTEPILLRSESVGKMLNALLRSIQAHKSTAEP